MRVTRPMSTLGSSRTVYRRLWCSVSKLLERNSSRLFNKVSSRLQEYLFVSFDLLVLHVHVNGHAAYASDGFSPAETYLFLSHHQHLIWHSNFSFRAQTLEKVSLVQTSPVMLWMSLLKCAISSGSWTVLDNQALGSLSPSDSILHLYTNRNCTAVTHNLYHGWLRVYWICTQGVHRTAQEYRIAGNFRGAKYSRLNTGPRIFYPRTKRPYLHVPLPAVQAATTNIKTTNWLIIIAELRIFWPPKIFG